MQQKTLARLVALVVTVGVGVAAVPLAAAERFGPLERILETLSSLGDVTRSWSRALPADERFQVLASFNDEAVLDRNTGLVWERAPEHGSRFWQSAQYSCLSATTGGQMGWRMPSISEFTSLVDPSRSNPALPDGNPFDTGGHAFFWTATRRASFDDLAWGFNLRDGFVDDYEFSLTASTWCVRGGVNSDEH